MKETIYELSLCAANLRFMISFDELEAGGNGERLANSICLFKNMETRAMNYVLLLVKRTSTEKYYTVFRINF